MPELRPYRRVLALIDFDDMDCQTVRKALLLARLNRAELDLLHLIAPDADLDGGYPNGNPRDAKHRLEAASLQRLAFLAARLGAAEATCHARHGPLRQGFLGHTGERQPDLVVTGRPHAYLSGAHDLLILSSSKPHGRGKLLAWILRFFNARSSMASC
ncbi:MAG: universal stress protein [Thiobacillus sp.]|nr:universal stress protein [Thiobacillus sp.]